MTKIWKRFTFEAAHRLPNVPPGHKCSRLHGHTFAVEIHVQGPVDEHGGWVLDFADIAVAWHPLHVLLDHNYLNNVEGLDNPTSELLARWIWRRLLPALPGLSRVVVQETCNSGAMYEGGDDR